MRGLAVLCGAAAVATILWSILLVSRGTQFVTSNVTVDDTYYYLLLALNHNALGFPTFDGVNPTNGFHPLWHGLLRVLALGFPSKLGLLNASLVLAAAFAGGCFAFIYGLARDRKSPPFGYALAALWLAYVVNTGAVTSGMESCTTALIFWWVIFAFQRLSRKELAPFWVAVPMALLLWSRLDCAFFIAALVVYHFLFNRKQAPLIAAIVAGALVPYVYLMNQWNGTLIPISGLIKTGRHASELSEYARRFIDRLETLSFSGIYGAAVTVALLLLCLASWKRWRDIKWIIPLGIASAAYLLVVSYTHWSVAKWYFVPIDITLLVAISAFVSSSATSTRIAIGVAGPLTLWSGYQLWSDHKRPDHVYVARYRASLWIDGNLPQNAVLASFNSGQLGYFTNRRMINLDGFVNSKEYAETVLSGKKSLDQYLAEQGVTHLVDYGLPRFALAFEDRPSIEVAPVRTKGRLMHLRVWPVGQ